MSNLEQSVHDRLESYRPDAAPPFDAILARSRRRDRVRNLMAVAGSAAALTAVVLAAGLTHRSAPGNTATQPATSGSHSPAAIGTVPAAVARAAVGARVEAGATAVKITWVRTTWGVWRRLAGQSSEPNVRDSTPVYVVQARMATAQTCKACKGPPVRGTVYTRVFGVGTDQPNQFTYGTDDYGVPRLPGARQLP